MLRGGLSRSTLVGDSVSKEIPIAFANLWVLGSLTFFKNAELNSHIAPSDPPATAKLGPSRFYNLCLAPQIIYARSKLLNALVSSGAHQQLEFQAVGSWWLCKTTAGAKPLNSLSNEETSNPEQLKAGVSLQRIPSSREDVFGDATLDVKSKRALMKFLRTMMQEESSDFDSSHEDIASFSEFVGDTMKIPSALHDPLLALSLLRESPREAIPGVAISRIRRHLVSIGVFGAGFAAVTPKWGGISEIAQVGCRAGAVGGATYMLGRGISRFEARSATDSTVDSLDKTQYEVELSNGEKIKTRCIVASEGDIPQQGLPEGLLEASAGPNSSRGIIIVSSTLEQLFPPTSENGPVPACAIVMFPAASDTDQTTEIEERPPVYLSIHSSDTGECPAGQCVIYASTAISDPSIAYPILDAAVERLLSAIEPKGVVLWQLHYNQSGLPPATLEPSSETERPGRTTNPVATAKKDGIIIVPSPSLDLAFDDHLVDTVKEAWAWIVGLDLNASDDSGEGAGDRFMVFDRPGNGEDEDD
ncbi:MAG: hypothetical protein Q9160_000350 [Pyrenula sp. 1 TL-2023]